MVLLAGPALPILNTVAKVAQFFIKVRQDNITLNAKFNSSLISIEAMLQETAGATRDQPEKYGDEQLQELVLDIEDSISLLWIPSLSEGFLVSVTGADHRSGAISSIESYKQTLEGLLNRRNSSSTPSQSGSGNSTAMASSSSDESLTYAPETALVGLSECKEKLVDLLSPNKREGAPKVISILGSSGVGKTALARVLFDDRAAVTAKFDCAAWVVASEHSSVEGLLKKILQEVSQQAAAPGNDTTTTQALHDFLVTRRYLIFIDNLKQNELWHRIQECFPNDEESNKLGSRIIVTTSVHSVANACSSGSYLYRMQCLSDANSKTLFWTPKPVPKEGSFGSDSVLKKCNGLPRALISTRNYLAAKAGRRPLLEKEFTDLGEVLGEELIKGNWSFQEINTALVQCYESLPHYNHKNCLLYASIFPRGHEINIKSLARRLIAEGLVFKKIDNGMDKELEFVRQCLEELINQSIIEKVLTENDSKVVERYTVQSIILEFTIHMSLSRNFVTLIDEQRITQKNQYKARRVITIQSSTEARSNELPEDLSSVRSLTIFNKNFVSEARLDFRRCIVLRILDLQGCKGIDNYVIDAICGLVFLKYLGLRKTDVKQIPSNVQHLLLLQTLDIRETSVNKLSIEVIMLPELALLFGKFELPPPSTYIEAMLIIFMSTESKLHTLAGIVIDGIDCFQVIIEHARMLKKVKLWCKDSGCQVSQAPAPTRSHGVNFLQKFASFLVCGKSSADGNPNPESPPYLAPATSTVTLPSQAGGTPGTGTNPGRLADDLESCIQKRPTVIGLSSLSVDFNGVPNDFLGFLKSGCTIGSIKVRKGLGSLPNPEELEKVRNITKLHLSSTGLGSVKLQDLQYMGCLEYLKLSEHHPGSWDGDFHVTKEGFYRLQWLCFKASKHPRVVIEKGGMPSLVSLELLCLEYSASQELRVERISDLPNLSEVTLHHSAPKEIVDAWQKEANEHINKPYVKKQPNFEVVANVT